MEFNNVRLIGKANIYENGKVSSRTFFLESGERKTLGFMLAGEYTFGTAAAEVMEVLQGSMNVLLPGESDWEEFSAGMSFDVPANSSFSVKVPEYADYCCSYGDTE